MSLLADATSAYNRFLNEQPILSQTLIMSAFCGLGDFLAQTNDKRKSDKPYNWKRVGKFTCKGIGCGILWSHWFMLAELWSESLTKWFLQSSHMDDTVKTFTIVRTIVNLLLEQFLACPIIFGLWDLPIIAIMDGKSLGEIPDNIRAKLRKLLVANAKLWTVVNVLIYNVPLNLRVLVVSIADLFWESIVSTVASRPLGDDEDEGGDEDGAQSKEKVS